MHSLNLHLLGAPRIEQDGLPLRLDTRKAVALLVYLAVTRQPQRRASLVNLLWPEYDRQHGRAALRRTIYVLKRALAGNWMEVDHQTVLLLPDADIWVDVNQFRRLLSECDGHGHSNAQVCSSCVAPLTSAVSLYHGEFLSGFGLRDSLDFDEWQLHQADMLRGELAGALRRLERWYIEEHDYEAALGFARRRLVLDPLDEQTHARLMVLYAWSGQRTSALQQYDTCVRVLEEQLGIPPQSSVTELCEAIKQGRPPTPLEGAILPSSEVDIGAIPSPPSSRTPFLHHHLPRFETAGQPVERVAFVAREPELAQLRGHLKDALDGRGSVAFVTGEAGSGKTALLQEYANRAQEEHEDLIVAWGRCNAYTGRGDPYLPFREVLELLTGDVESRWAAGAMTPDEARRLWYLTPLVAQVLLDVGRDLIGSMVPTSGLIRRARAFATHGSDWVTELEGYVRGGVEGGEGPRLQQSALFEQYARVLREISEQKPLLLILDDLQWVDDGSTSLLFHLGRRMEGSRILIVGAFRPADIAMGRSASVLQTGPLAGTLSTNACEDSVGFPIDRHQHPLTPILLEFKRSFGHVEVDLEQAQGRRFVDAFLDTEPNLLTDSFRETLYQHTQGYPLFTVELLQGMKEREDLLQDVKGQWVESGRLDWDLLPTRVEAVIAQRISRLPPPLRGVLDIACVEGETFTAEAVAEVGATDQRETIRHLSASLDKEHRLIRAFGVQQVGDQRLSLYRFRHILFQKYLYNRLDVVVRARLHNAVGLALERLYGDRAEQVAVRLARHFEEAAVIRPAVEYLRQAGDQARRVYANEEAQRHYRRALVLLGVGTPDQSLEGWKRKAAAHLYENLGELLTWVSEYEGASVALQSAVNFAPPDELAWQARLRCRIGNLLRIQGHYEGALHAYVQAESMLEEELQRDLPSWWQVWLEIQMNRIWTYYWMGEWREIAEVAERVKPAIAQHGSPRHQIDLLFALCTMHFRRDRYLISSETVATLQEALRLSLDLGDIATIAVARFELGFAYLWQHDYPNAEAELRAALEGAGRTGDVARQTRCLTYLTILHRMIEKTELTREFAIKSLEQATAAEMVEYVGTAHANLAWIAWQEGRVAEAEQNALRALESWRQTQLVYPFHWLALWPLIAVNLNSNQIGEAVELVHVLMQETQMPPEDELGVLLSDATNAWEANDLTSAKDHLHRAMELSDQLGYL